MDFKALFAAFVMLSVSISVIGMNEEPEEYEPEDAGSLSGNSYSFDFGSRDSPLKEFSTRVTSSTIYDPGQGYGLLAPAEEFRVTGRMLSEVSPYVLQRSWVFDEYGNELTVDGLRSEDRVSFRVDIPNGTYRLVLWLGDLEKGVYSMNVSVNDEWLLSGADAFHTVHRSMYFRYQPDPRNPEKEYINYGMAVPFFLEVNVTEGFMIINVTGNDTAYWDLLSREQAKEPPISYLTWMSTGGIKKSAGTGPWKYVGGPFTNASVLGLDIRPFPDLPIDGEIGELAADPDIDASEVQNGISAFNSGDLEGAFLHWQNAMDEELTGRNRLARSQLGLILAGALSLDREIEILPWVEADIRANVDLRGDPAQIELWTWANLANRGLKYEFERILYDEENPKNHFIEANKAFILLNQIPEISPLYPKMHLWAARCLMNLDPHRWTSASGTALEMMEGLRHLDPDNPYIRMYLDTNREDPPTWESPTPVISTTGVYDNWTLKDYDEGFEDAPGWASLIHEELGWLYDVTDWWVDRRMQENGYLGGGWTDDVEMIGLFGFDALISEGADDISLEGAGRFVDGMLESGQVNMDLGYSGAFADVEHTAELTGDSLPMMIAVDFGNPKWVEFSMKTAVLMRDLWMGGNEKGWYQFKSNYLSATRVGTGGQAEDSWINFRAVLPALWAWWYSNDPEIRELIVDWADCWVNAAMSTEKDKPMGVIPAGIGWPDGEIGGHDSPNWYTAAHPPGSVNYDWAPQKYKSYIRTLLETAFAATRNISFLEPLRLEAGIAQEYIDDPDPGAEPGTRKWAGRILGSGAVSHYRDILDRYQLPGGGSSPELWNPQSVVESCTNGHDYIRKCYPLMTTEASATDRVLFVGVVNPFLIYTGGYIGGALLAPQFTYSGLERDFAAMVRDANSRKANISLYGFFEGERVVGIIPWSLEIGGKYSIEIGPDTDGDGNMDSVHYVNNFTFLTRGQEIPFVLPGDVEYLVNIEQVEEGSGVRPSMEDPAFDMEDEVAVDKENGTVTVRVHNIGSEKVEDVDIYLFEDLDGGLRLIGGAHDVTIPAPSGMKPSIEEVDLRVWEEPWIGEVVIRMDPDDEMMEICESNNELRGYWDLEGIALTDRDLPLELTGEPSVTVYEDDEGSGTDVLDLSDFVIDPDGREVRFGIGSNTELPWSAIINGSVLTLTPSVGDWFGNFTLNVTATDPGVDALIGTDDDGAPLVFSVRVEVLPTNDPPELVGIMVDGTLIDFPSGGFLNLSMEENTVWTGELIVSDRDGDDVLISLHGEYDDISLDGTLLSVNGTGWPVRMKVFGIVLDDRNGTTETVFLRFILQDRFEGPEWIGARLPDGTLIAQDSGRLEVSIQQGEELLLELLVDPPEPILFSLVSGNGDVVISGNELILVTDQTHVDASPLEIVVRATDGEALSSDLTIIIHVIDVNDIPSAPVIDAGAGPFEKGDTVILSSEGSLDIDGDELEYMWDFGDGDVTDWGAALLVEHIYISTGDYKVTLSVRDGRGGSNSTEIVVSVMDSGAPSSDDEGNDAGDKRDERDLMLVIAALFLLAIIAVLIAVALMIGRKNEEKEVSAPEEGFRQDMQPDSTLVAVVEE